MKKKDLYVNVNTIYLKRRSRYNIVLYNNFKCIFTDLYDLTFVLIVYIKM